MSVRNQTALKRQIRDRRILFCFSFLDQLNYLILQTTTINRYIVIVEGAENG